MIKKVLLAVLVIGALVSVFFNYDQSKYHKKFLEEMAVIDHENDSLKADIAVMDAQIDSLEYVDEALTYKLAHQKTKIVKVIEQVDLAKAAIDTYSEHELVSSFNKRYPVDTLTNPLPLAQPVLVATAKDLAEFDGSKQLISIKDSTIALQDERISTKDTIISKYVAKEVNFKRIITNQDTQIQGWKGQYSKLEFQNKKLKLQNKFTKVAAIVVVGGLSYMMLTK
jgi:hypothetical protein